MAFNLPNRVRKASWAILIQFCILVFFGGWVWVGMVFNCVSTLSKEQGTCTRVRWSLY